MGPSNHDINMINTVNTFNVSLDKLDYIVQITIKNNINIKAIMHRTNCLSLFNS